MVEDDQVARRHRHAAVRVLVVVVVVVAVRLRHTREVLVGAAGIQVHPATKKIAGTGVRALGLANDILVVAEQFAGVVTWQTHLCRRVRVTVQFVVDTYDIVTTTQHQTLEQLLAHDFFALVGVGEDRTHHLAYDIVRTHAQLAHAFAVKRRRVAERTVSNAHHILRCERVRSGLELRVMAHVGMYHVRETLHVCIVKHRHHSVSVFAKFA